MRVSTFQIHNQAAQQLQSLGAQAADTQRQISYGKRLVNPSDDPVGAARLVSINQELGARAQYIANADAADTQLALEDATLQQLTETIQRVQELVIQAGSGVQSQEDRSFIAVEIQARFEELVSLANTKDAQGQFLFSGFQAGQIPFESLSDGVVYRGDGGQRNVQIDRGQFVAVNNSGEELFMRVPVSDARAVAGQVSSGEIGISGVGVVDQTLADAFYPDKLIVQFEEPAAAGGVPNVTVRRQSDLRVVDGLENVPYESGSINHRAGYPVSAERIRPAGRFGSH